MRKKSYTASEKFKCQKCGKRFKDAPLIWPDPTTWKKRRRFWVCGPCRQTKEFREKYFAKT